MNFNVQPFTVAGNFTITGGTGRFDSATGGGTFATSDMFLAAEELGLSIEFDGKIDY